MERYTSKKSPTDDKVLFIRHTRHTTEDLRRFGGLHAAPIGDSTRPVDALAEWFEQERQAAVGDTRWTQPF